jgi:uncharacterized protein YkwD
MSIQKEKIVRNTIPHVLSIFIIIVIFFVTVSLSVFQKTQAEEKVLLTNEAAVSNSVPKNFDQLFSAKDLIAETQTKQDVLNDPLIIKNAARAMQASGQVLTPDSIVFYINKERRNVGLEPLFENQALILAAEQKVKNMFSEQYFAHTSPEGEGLVDWVGSKYEYIAVGENLAMGDFVNEQEIVFAWMNSEKHRASILKSSYVQTGVAIEKGSYKGETLWMVVQIFGIPSSLCPQIDRMLLSGMNEYENSLKAVEKEIGSLNAEMNTIPQPSTKAEHKSFSVLVDDYNQLVLKRRNILGDLQETISLYNEQVQEHNACATEK